MKVFFLHKKEKYLQRFLFYIYAILILFYIIPFELKKVSSTFIYNYNLSLIFEISHMQAVFVHNPETLFKKF